MTNKWNWLIAVCAVVVASTTPGTVAAQSYPERPIKLVVPWPAGGATDSLARVLSQKLGHVLNQPVVVENRPGANGQIGVLAVARAAPDGYTLGLATMTSHAIGPAGSKSLPYDILTDFTHVGMIATAPMLLIVPHASPASSLPELVGQAKAAPEKLSYASYGVGSAPHLAGEMLSQVTNIQLLHVPYQGTAPASQALLGEYVSLYFDSVPSGFPLVQADRVRALGITSKQRHPRLPDVPTVGEVIPGFEEIVLWWGLSAPKGTPDDIVSKLNAALAEALGDPAVQEQLAGFGAQASMKTASEFAAYIDHEKARWEKVMRDGNISLN